MPKFEVSLSRWVCGPQYATVIVEAPDAEYAEALAIDLDVNWKGGRMRCEDGIDVDSVKEIN